MRAQTRKEAKKIKTNNFTWSNRAKSNFATAGKLFEILVYQ